MTLKNQEQGLNTLLKSHRESLVEIAILKDDKRVDLGHLMKNREGFDGPFIWVYTGGYFTEDNRYTGDVELSYIGIWPDPIALINLFSNLKNPYRGPFGFKMNRENKALMVDLKFEIVIRRHP